VPLPLGLACTRGAARALFQLFVKISKKKNLKLFNNFSNNFFRKSFKNFLKTEKKLLFNFLFYTSDLVLGVALASWAQ
jgi:hypothetical protein